MSLLESGLVWFHHNQNNLNIMSQDNQCDIRLVLEDILFRYINNIYIIKKLI